MQKMQTSQRCGSCLKNKSCETNMYTPVPVITSAVIKHEVSIVSAMSARAEVSTVNTKVIFMFQNVKMINF